MSIPDLPPAVAPRATGDSREIPSGVCRRLIEAARWSSSAFNRQPWRFVLGRRPDQTFGILCDALTAGNRRKVESAGALLVAAVRTLDSDGRKVSGTEYELGLAVSRLATQAQSEGLELKHFGGFDRARVRARFAVPADYRILSLVSIGWSGCARRHHLSERLPLTALVFSENWGQPAVLVDPPTPQTGGSPCSQE